MWVCNTCPRTFASERACVQHMNALDHWAPTFTCDTCPLAFRSQQDCHQHMHTVGHWQNYCTECKRAFDTENNLRMHLNSRVHRGAVVTCPLCKQGFVTASGVSHHLETGSCPSARAVNRDTIYRALRERDPHGVITNKQLEWHGETHTQMWAPEQAWNGHYYECYLCHREFSGIRPLEQHLNSPAHQQKIYHCPNRQCARPFVTLAAMFNHLESESCGFIRFEKVQQGVNDFLTGRQRLIVFA